MLSVRRLEEEDYNQLVGWWKFWRFPAPTRDMLPENATCGLMVYKDEVLICSGFIYFTNSKIAWVEFIVSNPDYREKDRKEALVFLIEQLTNLIKQKGFKAIYTNLKNESLINHFELAGFGKGSNKTTEMIKVL